MTAGLPGGIVLKRLKHLLFSGIRNKIFLLILITIALITMSFFVVSNYQGHQLSEMAAETSRRQQLSIADTTVSVMVENIREHLTQTTRLKAQTTDQIFTDARARVLILRNYAERLYAFPDSFELVDWMGPIADLDGALAPMMLLAPDVDPADPDTEAAVGLLANMSDLMVSICESTMTDDIYMAIPQGAFLTISKHSGSWINPDGTPKRFDARTRFWYRQALEAGTDAIFTDVETDANTGKLSLVCAVPVRNQDGEICAVIGTDLFLDDMTATMRASDGDSGYHLIVNHDGHVIASSLEDPAFRVEVSGSAPDLRESDNAELAAFIREAVDGNVTDVTAVPLKDGTYYMTSMPVRSVGWAMISVYDAESTTRPATQLIEHYLDIESEGQNAYRAKNQQLRVTILIVVSVLIVILGAAALIQGKRIVKPLNTMTEQIAGMKDEEIEFKMKEDYRTGDEIEILADSFSRLSRKTINYIGQVREAAAEKQRINSELRLAAGIQASMLPHVFPPFPDRHEFEIYASMDPAREVGGDFYDYFLIDSDHLGLAIADVSGKGVPASLIMMISKVILQNCAMLGRSPADVLAATNDAICANNQEDMFVTVWLGVLEISTGKLTAASAGHEYPAVMRAGGDYELWKNKHGFVVGAMQGMHWKEFELQMHPGDRLFLYTDGVPEATSSDDELFGTDRMLDVLNTVKDASPENVLKGVRKAIDRFVKDAEQFDDITMLSVVYKGPQA